MKFVIDQGWGATPEGQTPGTGGGALSGSVRLWRSR